MKNINKKENKLKYIYFNDNLSNIGHKIIFAKYWKYDGFNKKQNFLPLTNVIIYVWKTFKTLHERTFCSSDKRKTWSINKNKKL